MNIDLSTPLAISQNNVLKNQSYLNTKAGLNANGTIKTPSTGLAGQNPISTKQSSGAPGWVGAVVDGVNNVAQSFMQGSQAKKQEQLNKQAQQLNRRQQALQNTMMTNNNFNNINTLPLGVRKNDI